MSIDNRAKSYGTIWADWTIGEELGRGSGGKTVVYKLSRENGGFVENDVLKVVNIIEENIGLNEMSPEYREEYNKREAECIKKAKQEVGLMHLLQNSNNIVTYQDFKVNKMHEEHFTAVDLLIRMHKYEDLSSRIKRQSLSEDEVIDVANDMCVALGECKKFEIVHRDIKPDNIFCVEKKYLLGDFGISRIIESGDVAQTSKGTKPYAAPEQFAMNGENAGYDHRVDIYSLGITLYQLANKGKLPFVDEYGSINNAIIMRLSGNPIPPIKDINPELNKIILKACQFKADDRYQDINDMLKDIKKLRENIEKKKYGAVNDSGYYTEQIQSNKIDPGAYFTEQAISKPDTTDEYSTELVNIQLTNMDTYVTEPAMEKTVKEYKLDVYTESDSNKKADIINETINNSDEIRKNHNDSVSECFECENKESAIIDFKNIVKNCNADLVLNEISQYYSDNKIALTGSEDAIFWYEKFMEYCKDTWTISLTEYRLGEIYSKGIGIKRNNKLAEKYYASSAAKGNPYAKKKFVAGKYIK